MSASYANVVATGSATPEQSPVKLEEPVEQISTETTTEATESSTESTEAQLPSPKAEKPPQKVLAPAPVPQVSAWSSANSSRSNSNVDEKHWPSPLEVPQTQQQQISKKIVASKTSKEKWVPFKASVVLPQPGKKSSQNANNQNQKRNQKNTNNNGNVLSQNNKQQPFAQDKKRKNKPQEKRAASSAPAQTSTQKKETKEEKTEAKDASAESTEATQHQHNSAPHQHNQSHNNHSHHNHNHNNQNLNLNQQFPPQNGQFPPQQRNGQLPPFTPNGQPFFPSQFQGRQFRPNYNRRFNKFNNNNNGTFRQNGQFTPQYRRNGSFNKDEPLFSISKQIEYYFSIENLVKDIFLRKQMNDEGWLSVGVIGNFYRMQVLSSGDINMVKRGLEDLNGGVLELAEFEGDELKVRVKENWTNWILPADQRDENGNDGKKLIQVVAPKAEETAEEKFEEKAEEKTEEKTEA